MRPKADRDKTRLRVNESWLHFASRGWWLSSVWPIPGRRQSQNTPVSQPPQGTVFGLAGPVRTGLYFRLLVRLCQDEFNQ